MQTLPSIKAGDTYAFTAKYATALGVAVTGLASLLSCQVRDRLDNLKVAMVIEETAVPGTYLFATAAEVSTQDWYNRNDPLLFLDIEYTVDGVHKSTVTLGQPIEKDVTHP
jgi:hypothetical protein